MRRALAIDEASYDADHPEVATDLNNLAQLLKATNRLSEAEALMRRALVIAEASYGAAAIPTSPTRSTTCAAAAGYEPAGRGQAADAPSARNR